LGSIYKIEAFGGVGDFVWGGGGLGGGWGVLWGGLGLLVGGFMLLKFYVAPARFRLRKLVMVPTEVEKGVLMILLILRDGGGLQFPEWRI